MPKYTTYIPKEFFFADLTAVQIFVAFVIILAIILFFGYKFYKITSIKKKPESF